jgi:ubiquinone/menaquinone biosynthesis C-methylase UbiE
MAHRVCPAWLGHMLACPLRRLIHKPEAILRPYLDPGMTVLEIGPGMGFFSVPMAEMVGPSGRIICVDVQPKMLQGLQRRAKKAGVAERIVTRVCSERSLGVDDLAGHVDFALAFAVAHEVPDARPLFLEVQRALKPGASCLIAEPRGHVSSGAFKQTLLFAPEAGLEQTGQPAITRCHTALVRKHPA